mmetsp:Transcript_35962/g.65857  ORF Transcript_35962/g.65857 Transcript_35962/m.65857 type:complete len:203 (-) Transcript_35962:701-1309(-)
MLSSSLQEAPWGRTQSSKRKLPYFDANSRSFSHTNAPPSAEDMPSRETVSSQTAVQKGGDVSAESWSFEAACFRASFSGAVAASPSSCLISHTCLLDSSRRTFDATSSVTWVSVLDSLSSRFFACVTARACSSTALCNAASPAASLPAKSAFAVVSSSVSVAVEARARVSNSLARASDFSHRAAAAARSVFKHAQDSSRDLT